MRKSIFDIVSDRISIKDEAKRIIALIEKVPILLVDGYKDYTLLNFTDNYSFRDWSKRGHFINVNDFLNTLGYTDLKHDAQQNPEALLMLIELVYNFWYLANELIFDDSKNYQLQYYRDYDHLKDIMDDLLEQYNHIAYIDEKKSVVYVIENKAEVTSVAEIMPEEICMRVIKYNHRALAGDIEAKKSILVALGAELEPRRKELTALHEKLADAVFFMLNNMHLRHNNRSKKDLKNYKEYVAKMKKSQLEKWYDELYQMMLIAFLLLDNTSRIDRIKDLKNKVYKR